MVPVTAMVTPWVAPMVYAVTPEFTLVPLLSHRSFRPSELRFAGFGFEMSNPAQLASVLNTIKQIDAVYDAFRILPGGARLA